MTKHVLQKDAWGCSIAAIAMCVGRDYDTVKAEVEMLIEKEINENRGISHIEVWEWLIGAGYAWQQKYKYHYKNKLRDPWPPPPWAPLHYCEVHVSQGSGGHAVVMLEDGTVLDPLTEAARRLADYHQVNLVMGLWKIA